MNCRGGTAGVELALIAALLPAPSRPMWPQNGVRQAGTTSFVQNQNVARLSHPYGLDHISNCCLMIGFKKHQKLKHSGFNRLLCRSGWNCFANLRI